MKPKNILLILIVIVMIPEILLVAYIFSKYSITIDFSPVYSTDFLSFLLVNPVFFVVLIVVIIMMLILYFALQIK